MSLFPTWPQWRTLPHTLTKEEKWTILGLVITMAVSLGYIGFAFYMEHTTPLPDYGGEYREGVVGNLEVVTPLFLSDSALEQDIARLIFSGLVSYDTTGALHENLARHIEIQEQGKVYLATLRNDVVWHDGERFDADDVIFTFDVIQNPSYQSRLRTLFKDVTMEKIDQYTIKYILPAPDYLFLERLTFGIIPEHIMRDLDPKKMARSATGIRAIGTGPYQFDSLEEERGGTITSYTLARNESYYGTKPYLDHITFRIYSSNEELFAALRDGNVDGIAGFDAQAKVELPDEYRIYRIKMPRYFALFLNPTNHPALNEKPLRQALDRAIDRDTLVTEILGGEGEAVLTMFPSLLGISAPPSKNTTRESVEALFDASGWKQNGENTTRRKAITQGSKTETKTLSFNLVTSNTPELERTATRIQEQLKAYGIEITIRAVSVNDLTNDYLKTRKYDILLFGELLSLTPNPTVFWHSEYKKYPGLNFSVYESKAVDTLLEELPKATTPEIRKEKYEALARAIQDDAPAIFLYSPHYLYAIHNDIQGIRGSVANLPNWRFVGVTDWYRETARVWKRE